MVQKNEKGTMNVRGGYKECEEGTRSVRIKEVKTKFVVSSSYFSYPTYILHILLTFFVPSLIS